MPEAPEINVLVKQLKHLIVGEEHKIYFIKDVTRDNKDINIFLSNYTMIVINLRLKGFLSLIKTQYTKYKIDVYGHRELTIYINDTMKLATMRVKKIKEKKHILPFRDFCGTHPTMSIGNALINYKIGIGKYLLKEIFGYLKMSPLVKCKNLTSDKIQLIEETAVSLIKHITKLGGKNTYNDLYGKPGKYIPRF